MNTSDNSAKEGLLTGSLFDLLLGFIGWYVICFVPISSTATTLGDPFRKAFGVSPVLPAAVLALPLATAYWLRGGSLDDLGSFVLYGTAVFFVFGVPAMLLLGVFDAAPATESLESLVLNTVFLALVYSVTYWLVYRNGLDKLRQHI